MRFILLVTTSVAIWQCAVAAIEYCSNVKGSSGPGEGNIFQPLNYEPGPVTVGFQSQAFSSDGSIIKWELYSTGTGTFYAIVLRKVTGNTYELVGRNRLVIEDDTTGVKSFSIGINQRVRARVGDFIGISHDRNATHSVVYVELGSRTRTPDAPTPGTMLTIDSSINQMSIEDNLVLTPAADTGVVSMRAIVTDVSPFLKLEGGPTAREGWATMYRDNVWGYICDKWYVPGGWPKLMCYSMGYPDVLGATDATTLGIHEDELKEGPLHMMNIRCKPSQNITIFSCDRHVKQACNHDHDVYIKCKSKVGLGNMKNGVGIPQAFDCGNWGLICDTKDPKWHEDHEQQSWVTALCKDMGYSRFSLIERAATADLGKLVGLQDTWKNPECDTTAVTQLHECRTSILSKRVCDNQYYKVKCA